MALADENTSVMDGLGQSELEDLGLETPLEEILDLEAQDVIELHAVLVQDSNTNETAEEGIAFEETAGVLLLKGQELTSVLPTQETQNYTQSRGRKA